MAAVPDDSETGGCGLNPPPSDAARIPAILVRFSRYSARLESDPPRRQGWQIVQSQLTLDDSLP